MYWAGLSSALFPTADLAAKKSKYIKPQNRPFGGQGELSFTDTKQDRSSCDVPFAFNTEKHDKNIHLLSLYCIRIVYIVKNTAHLFYTPIPQT